MKVDRETLAKHRAAMREHAGKLFRRHGIAAVGVADIAQAAGLTHGAFYGHFASKSALAAEAVRESLTEAAAKWRRRAARATDAGRDPLGALIDAYLTEAHRDDPETGCALATLGTEAARDPALRAAIGDGAIQLATVIEDVIAATRPGIPPERRNAVALAILAAMNGGLILARTLADMPATSDATLAAARDAARRAAA